MKKILLFFSLLAIVPAMAQDGHEIKVVFKPFKNKYIYLGHYFGKTYPIVDSVKLNENSEGVFKGKKKLQGGIYLLGYPNKAGFFEFLVDKNQHFTILADTATIHSGAKFINSEDNTLFTDYQQTMAAKGRNMSELQAQLKTASPGPKADQVREAMTKLDKEVKKYREDFIKAHPDNILTAFLICMREPELTGRLKEPKTKEDSTDSYNFFKQHYWDGVNFWDGRLAYTTFFDEKVEKYFTQLVPLDPDSVIKELDYMLGYASINEEMTRFLLVKFVNRYLIQKYMWEDAVYVHLFQKYFAQKDYPWLTAQGRKTITDRAYSLMANLLGEPAPEINLPNMTGKPTSLYGVKKQLTLVSFWDPTCGHCKIEIPRLDSFYRAKWKSLGIEIFAVAKETDGNKSDWFSFIKNNKLEDWSHVYNSKSDERARIDSGIPSYSQLYDVSSFPTFYLLDEEKRIVAKKLGLNQLDELIREKTKNNPVVSSKPAVLEKTNIDERGLKPAFDPVLKATPGKYYALIIGVSDYKLAKLKLDKPESDARQLKKILTTAYNFSDSTTNMLLNPTRQQILTELFRLRKILTSNDNLLIFFAGHGYWDEEAKQGYWWARDAGPEDPSSWLSNSDIKEQIRSIRTAHTLLISDACFSGGIFKTRSADIANAPKEIQALYKMKSRRAITSGTMTTVPDVSVFFYYLAKRLEENTKPYLTSQELFDSMRTAVINNANAVPQDGVIAETGDEGGDFIFILKKK